MNLRKIGLAPYLDDPSEHPSLTIGYYYVIEPVAILASLTASAVVLSRVRKYGRPSWKPQGHGWSGLYYSLVWVHSSFHVALYGTLALFLPLFYAFTDIKLSGSLDALWFPSIHGPPIQTVVSLLDFFLVTPIAWSHVLWHLVIVFTLRAMVVKHTPPQELHAQLPILCGVACVLACLKAISNITPAIRESFIPGFIIASCLQILFAMSVALFAYSDVLFTMARGGAQHKARRGATREIERRLFWLCTYTMIHGLSWVVLLGALFLGTSQMAILPVRLVRNIKYLFQGFVDSMLLGGLCCGGSRAPTERPKLVKRQTSDDRIRKGSSVSDPSALQHAISSSSAPSGPPPSSPSLTRRVTTTLFNLGSFFGGEEEGEETNFTETMDFSSTATSDKLSIEVTDREPEGESKHVL